MVEISQARIAATGNDIVEPDEVETARRALASLDPNDEEYFEALDLFATKLVSRFARFGNANDLDEGIVQTKLVLDLAPSGHFFHTPALCNMGQALIKRFKFQGSPSDLSQAVSYFEAAVTSCTPEESLYLSVVGCLASGLLSRYRIYGDTADLDRIIDTGTAALSASPAQSLNRDALLNNLANALKERFTKHGNRTDLDTALAHHQACLDLRPSGHPLRHSALGNHAEAMLLKFEVDGHFQDLESAANYYVSALQLRAPGQEGYLLYLTSLGVVYWRLFVLEGTTERIEMAIDCYRTAMEHSKVPNLDHSRLLDNYAAALQLRYMLIGNIDDLDQAIEYLTTSSSIMPSTYSGRAATIYNLGSALITRFHATGNVVDLDSSIENLSVVLQLPPGYHQLSLMLSVYGGALSTRFSQRGDTNDLDLAVSTCKDALTLSSPNEPHYSSAVTNLTSTLLDCLYRSGTLEDCKTIIDHCDRALVSMRPGELIFVSLRINHAKAFLQKFLLTGEETDIDTSIAAFRKIIPTIPEGHKEYVHANLQFGTALESRFKHNANQKDLDECIALYQVAHRHCKRGNPHYASVCMQLGNALRERSEYHHDAGDAQDEAIVLLAEVEEILSATPGHIDYKGALVNLGVALFMRFLGRRNKADLDAAVEHVSRALTLPAFAEEFVVQFTFATLLSVRYVEEEDLADLEKCVELFGTVAERMPPKHLVRANLCRNYGQALVKLSHHRDRLQYLNAAIPWFKEAAECLPESHYDQPLTCMRLAEVLHERAKLLGDSDGLYEAIELLRGVMRTLAEDTPMFHSVCLVTSRMSLSMYGLSAQQDTSLMEEGFQYYQKAVHYSYANSFASVSTALEWVERAEYLHHPSALLAYQASLRFLYQHLLTTPSIKSRHAVLLDRHWDAKTGTLATDATACAIGRGELALAVELSEQGRGLLWSQLSQSRTPLDALRLSSDAGRGLASDFERVSAQLARSTVAPEATVSASRLTVEEATRRYRQLSTELENVIARIRQQDGFSSFLDRPSFESLQSAAVEGPVILVNVHRQRCDGLIVLHDAPPRLVPLPDTSLEELTTLSTRFYHMLRTTSGLGEEKMREREVVVVLRTLWDSIVQPIVDELTPLIPRGSRIWWCPTSKLTTLPLHAAGPYRKGALNLPNIYVSSYTPTLAALIRARHRPPSVQPRPPTFVAIGQAKPASSTGPVLQSVSAELELVRSLLPSSPPPSPFSSLEGDASTADAALSALSTHGWAHLACHGYPNVERPFDSAFALGDRVVTVLDVVRARHVGAAAVGQQGPSVDNQPGHITPATPTPGEFAFLSACHTTVGDRNAPDEIIHLASAMQFSGFRSVIGTMWAVDDGMARHMVRGFYECMFPAEGKDKVKEGGTQWDCTRAARALNRAAKAVDKNAVSIDQRIVFVHIGA